jgi:hypothetical protein
MEISLERAGRFHAVGMKPNGHKCASMRTRTYPYFLKIDATDERLTKEGFVINNESIQSYFDKRWGVEAGVWDAVSCEVLAITSAKEICAMLLKQGVSVQRVLCRIRGSNNAWVEAICNPSEVN